MSGGLTVPRNADLLTGLRKRFGELTAMDYWFPVLQSHDVPVPKTVLIPAENIPLYAFEDCKLPAHLDELIAKIQLAVIEVGGPPAFLRTGYHSAKHRFVDSCYLQEDSAETLVQHIYSIFEYGEMSGELIGPPHDLWVVREYLPIDSQFTAFDGLPIAREFRLFCEKGVPVRWQPYWPEKAIADWGYHTPDLPDNWRELLAQTNALVPEELKELIRLSRYACSRPGLVEHDWSIDWLWASDRGWVCIDMAEADKSYVSPDVRQIN